VSSDRKRVITTYEYRQLDSSSISQASLLRSTLSKFFEERGIKNYYYLLDAKDGQPYIYVRIFEDDDEFIKKLYEEAIVFVNKTLAKTALQRVKLVFSKAPQNVES